MGRRRKRMRRAGRRGRKSCLPSASPCRLLLDRVQTSPGRTPGGSLALQRGPSARPRAARTTRKASRGNDDGGRRFPSRCSTDARRPSATAGSRCGDPTPFSHVKCGKRSWCALVFGCFGVVQSEAAGFHLSPSAQTLDPCRARHQRLRACP